MSRVKELELKPADRLPDDWREQISYYEGHTAQHYQRVMHSLSVCDWMTQDERERAAFVIVEKEILREQGIEFPDDDDD